MNNIKKSLAKLTKHEFVNLTSRGNAAIEAALSLFNKNDLILIPEEGGWLSYQKLPPKLGLKLDVVKCDDAKINLKDLKKQLLLKPKAFLYHNPGGYFAEQPMKEIYQLCKENNCLVIMDVAGSIGTKLCDGDYADIIVGSFGKWKLIDAKVGGFISCNDEELFSRFVLEEFNDEDALKLIEEKIELLPKRIAYLSEIRNKVVNDLQEYEVLCPNDLGFVVVVTFSTTEIREKIINYCAKNELEWTECPRYIRVNKKAISIEVKRR